MNESPTPARRIPPELAASPDYEIIRELGSGGMGLVFLAHNHIMGRHEVLKVISRELIGNPGVLDRFLREIRAVAKLHHPNIVTAYSAFRAGESLVFAMEYAAGLDLARMVKAKGPMPVGHACSFIHQAALGLQHAHEAGMVHRDIKPGNLMLTHAENRAVIKVLDFGLAKATSEQNEVELAGVELGPQTLGNAFVTGIGWMLGTPSFIAPEQIVDAQRADIRADIYSLGCTLYFLLSGRPPFEGSTTYDTLKAHRSAAAPLLNEVRPDVPADLAQIVATMMAKKPRSRLQTPAEVSKALAPFFKTASTPAKAADQRSAPGGQPSMKSATPVPETERLRADEKTPPAAAAARPVDPAPQGLVDLDFNDDDEWESSSAASTAAGKRRLWLLTAAAGLTAATVGALLWVGLGQKPPVPGLVGPQGTKQPPAIAAKTGAAKEPESRQSESPGPMAPAPAPARAPEAKPVVIASSEPPPKAPAGPADMSRAQLSTPKAAEPIKKDTQPKRAVEEVRLSKFDQDVDRAIRDGVRFLRSLQQSDGSWVDVELEATTGMTSLVTLALLAAGETPDSPSVRKSLEYLRGFTPDRLRNTYAISLQTMVFAAAEPERDQLRIAANVGWLEDAQIKPADQQDWPGGWTYSNRTNQRPGDNSNTQFALVALDAAQTVGATVKPEVWVLALSYWAKSQQQDGSRAYTPRATVITASMTCAGISSLILCRHWMAQARGQEYLTGESIRDCGRSGLDANAQAGLDWLASHFHVDQNVGGGQQWKFYYLHHLERAATLAGVRYLGQNDWYRLGAQELLKTQNKLGGWWQGAVLEADKALATSFAVLFLAKGRAPVVINKLRYGASARTTKKARITSDWDNDLDDVRNLVEITSRNWKRPLSWQIVNSKTATVSDMLRAPILFLNGHYAPVLTPPEQKKLREYVEQGGTLLAEACCGTREFDQGFKAMLKEMFPEEEYRLEPLSDAHPIWRATHLINPEIHPLWGIRRGTRHVVIYSPRDLSCYWNQADRDPANPAVQRALKLGQNMIEYVAGAQGARIPKQSPAQ
jgi:serine/threonine protein kinase